MSPALLLIAAIHAAPQAELLDFTATWCGPCQQMGPIVEKLHREGFPVRQVDVDQHRDLATRYRITGIPAFVLVVNGQEVGRLVGAQRESNLRALLRKIPAPTEETSAEPSERKSIFPWLNGRKEESPEPPQFSEDPPVIKRAQNEEAPAAVPVAPAAARDPIQAAVRIRVKDARGIDYGSGTVIASRDGKALVLTCYHIFRDFGQDAAVEIDLFPEGPQKAPQIFPGKLIKFDEEADVALVGVANCRMIAVSPVAPEDAFPKAGDHVFSVGCGNGEPPTKLQHTVTRINPYKGPHTTECTGMPVVGRSGGGLFDRQGRVIGVCFAAARESKTGVYVGADEIHKLLHVAGYAALVPAKSEIQVAESDSAAPAVGEEPFAPEESAAPFEESPFAIEGETTNVADTDVDPRPELSPGTDHTEAIAALEAGAEVVCMIRRLDKPGAPSEVIVINKASQRFIRYLRGELDDQTVETSMRIPAGRTSPAGNAAVATPRLEPACYQFVAAARVRSAGVALLRRVFDNRDR